MQNNSMPEIFNPMIKMMEGNMSMIDNITPARLPKMNYDDNIFSMIFGGYKRRKMEEATKVEKMIAENSRDTIYAKCDGIIKFITCSAELADKFGEFEQKKNIRILELQALQAEVRRKTSEAQLAGYEAEHSRIDLEIKKIQLKEIGGVNESSTP